MPELLIAAILAPVVVVPACQVGASIWRVAVRWHYALNWPERIVIGLFVLTAVINVARVAAH